MVSFTILTDNLILQCFLLVCYTQHVTSFPTAYVMSKHNMNSYMIHSCYLGNVLLNHQRKALVKSSFNTHAKFSRLSSGSSLQSSLLTSLDTSQMTPIILKSISALSTYIGLVAFYDRPRGKLCVDEDSFTLKQSQVQNAGLGLYVTKSLPKGTVLGSYPGVLRPASKFLQKYESIPQTAVYTWRFTDNEFCIDPTNEKGELLDNCLGGTNDYPLSYVIHEQLLCSVTVPTYLARINEPPINGGGCNVRSEEDLDKREVIFELSRDVVAGEELFMDYGLTYDRSGYQANE